MAKRKHPGRDKGDDAEEEGRRKRKKKSERRVSFGPLPQVSGEPTEDEGKDVIVKIRVGEDKNGELNSGKGKRDSEGRKVKKKLRKGEKKKRKEKRRTGEKSEDVEVKSEENRKPGDREAAPPGGKRINQGKVEAKALNREIACVERVGDKNDIESGREKGDDPEDSSDAGSGNKREEKSDEGEAGDAKMNVESIKTGGQSSIDTFAEMQLDPRVCSGIDFMGFTKPTPVQAAIIPAALKGRDVLATAPTGSGKTAAFAIPILQRLCSIQRDNEEKSSVRAAVLVPTKELTYQVAKMIRSLGKYIDGLHVSTIGKKGRGGDSDDAAYDVTSDIIVGTPTAFSTVSKVRRDALSSIEFIVIDEADLVLSYGYESEARQAIAAVPSSAQAILVSATLEADGIEDFHKVVLRNPVTVEVSVSMEDTNSNVKHHFARLQKQVDRYLAIYAMLRLQVISGKTLLFTNSINSAFRLKLFLDQFRVQSAVLHSELPANARSHCVEQFNRGMIDILLAADEAYPTSSDRTAQLVTTNGTPKEKGKRERFRRKKDEEFGISRGVDFHNVSVVVNFDLPQSRKAYTHRAGRTGRAGRSGTVLTLIMNDEQEAELEEYCKQAALSLSPLAFRMDQIEGFRYRVEDSLRAVSDGSVKAARLADVKREIVNSERLADYFEENPQDLDALKHDLSLSQKPPAHLAHIPEYLLPPALRGAVNSKVFAGVRKRSHRRKFRKSGRRDQNDPLKSMRLTNPSSRDRWQSTHRVKRKKKPSRKRGVNGQYFT